MKEGLGENLTELVKAYLSYMADYRRCSPWTVRAYRGDLGQFAAFCEAVGVSCKDLTKRDVLAWVNSLGHLEGATVRRKVAALSSFFTYLCDSGILHHNPAHRIPLPQKKQSLPRLVSQEEAEAIFRACQSPWLRCALVLLQETGIRRAELVGIRLTDLDWEHDSLLVRGKGSRQRLLPLSDAAEKAIRDYLPLRERKVRADTLLVNQLTGGAVTKDLLFRVLRMTCWRAGIVRPVTPHMFRHSFATTLVRNHVDIRTVQELLGHASLETTAKYLHSDLDTKRAAVEALAK